MWFATNACSPRTKCCLLADGGSVGLTSGRTPLRDQLGLNDPDAVTAADNRRAEKVPVMPAALPLEHTPHRRMLQHLRWQVSTCRCRFPVPCTRSQCSAQLGADPVWPACRSGSNSCGTSSGVTFRDCLRPPTCIRSAQTISNSKTLQPLMVTALDSRKHSDALETSAGSCLLLP